MAFFLLKMELVHFWHEVLWQYHGKYQMSKTDPYILKVELDYSRFHLGFFRVSIRV